MTHTWADVAYSFVNDRVGNGDISPFELMVLVCGAVAVVYMYVRFR